MAAADGMGMGRRMRTPPRPSWDLAMGLNMDKPKTVAQCLIAGYRDWTVKSYKGQEPKWTTIDPGMGKIDQLIQDDANGRFDELVGRVSPISKEKLDKSLVPWPDQEKGDQDCRDSGGNEAPGSGGHGDDAVHLAAILCAAVPTDPAFLVPYNDAFAYEECVGVTGNALPVDNSVEPAAQPCGEMWVCDPKSWPEWKTAHPQTTLVTTVADQAEVAFGEHPGR